MVFRLEEELKACSSGSSSPLEEDEGFGDWSQRMENRGEQEVSEEWSRRRRRAQTTPSLERKAEPGEEEQPKEEESQEAQRSPEVKIPIFFCCSSRTSGFM